MPTTRRGTSFGSIAPLRDVPRADTQLFPEVDKLRGDRNEDLTALEGREWDVVIDNSATVLRWVRQSAELLKHSVSQYIYGVVAVRDRRQQHRGSRRVRPRRPARRSHRRMAWEITSEK